MMQRSQGKNDDQPRQWEAWTNNWSYDQTKLHLLETSSELGC